jgi:hypothetical protein
MICEECEKFVFQQYQLAERAAERQRKRGIRARAYPCPHRKHGWHVREIDRQVRWERKRLWQRHQPSERRRVD